MIIDIVSRVDFYSACIYFKRQYHMVLLRFVFFLYSCLFYIFCSDKAFLKEFLILHSRFLLTMLSDLFYISAAKLEFAV